MADAPDHFPCKPGDWASDGRQVAKVKAVEWDGSEVIVDLVIYSIKGDKLGRVSPAMGGPRSFEPCCSWRFWHRISEPSFPLTIGRVLIEGTDRVALDYVFPQRLPDLQWKRRARRARARRVHHDDALEALRQIAAGHNDARQLAQTVVGRIEGRHGR